MGKNKSGSDSHNSDSTTPVKDRFNNANERRLIFKDEKLLQPTNIVDEDRIVGRDEQLDEVIYTLEPAFDNNPPDDMLLHGPPGTGKSLIVRTVANKFVELGDELGHDFSSVYLNCRNITSEDSAAFNLGEKVADELDIEFGLARSGITTTEKYERLFEMISEHTDHIVLILDELESLVGRYRTSNDDYAYSDLLYELSRATDNYDIGYQLTVAVLTNDGDSLEDGLDPRVSSSFSPQRILFDDYDADQLRSILNKRRDAFREGVLDEGVIMLCAAFAAQGEGDARVAINLLNSAGKLARRNRDNMVLEEHCREAREEFKTDLYVRELKNATISKRATVYAAALCEMNNPTDIEGAPKQIIYKIYRNIAQDIKLEPKGKRKLTLYLDEYVTNSLLEKNKNHFGQSIGTHSIYEFQTDPTAAKDAILEATDRFNPVMQDSEYYRQMVEEEYEEAFEDL